MNIHFIQHESFEAPGAYLEWALSHGYQVGISKVFESDLLPESMKDIDMLIILGGPQDPDTSIEDCPHFNAAAEKSVILKAISDAKPVVGVCLGAQLIGEAIGARFQHSPEKEIGVYPITLSDEGMKDELISHFGQDLMVGHWHNDMPGLNADCKILASSEGCPRQIIAYAELVYAFQCHMEFNTELVELLIAEEFDFLNSNTTHRFVQSPNKIAEYDYDPMNALLHTFLDKLTLRYLAKQSDEQV